MPIGLRATAMLLSLCFLCAAIIDNHRIDLYWLSGLSFGLALE